MHQSPQGESIWGTINTCVEIALGIYEIVARDEDGIEHTGIMARKADAERSLSQKAIEMAQQEGDWLCYDENAKDIPTYEVLQRRVAACKKIESMALAQMAEIKRDGKLLLTDYFGECNPPTETHHSPVTDMLKIRNGIFFTQDDTEMLFAVHEAVANNYMSALAAEFGHRQGEYLFYDLNTCAIALNELKNVFEEADALVISADSLYATLHKNFLPYTTLYNEMVQEEYQIPETDGPANLFLKVQLENAKEEQMQQEEPMQGQHDLPEDDFSEDVSYHVEQ